MVLRGTRRFTHRHKQPAKCGGSARAAQVHPPSHATRKVRRFCVPARRLTHHRKKTRRVRWFCAPSAVSLTITSNPQDTAVQSAARRFTHHRKQPVGCGGSARPAQVHPPTHKTRRVRWFCVPARRFTHRHTEPARCGGSARPVRRLTHHHTQAVTCRPHRHALPCPHMSPCCALQTYRLPMGQSSPIPIAMFWPKPAAIPPVPTHPGKSHASAQCSSHSAHAPRSPPASPQSGHKPQSA